MWPFSSGKAAKGPSFLQRFGLFGVLMLVILLLVGLNLLVILLKPFVPELAHVNLGAGWLLLAFGGLFLVILTIIQLKWNQIPVDKKDFALLVLGAIGLIAIIIYMPRVLPEAFSSARTEIITALTNTPLNSFLPVP